MDDDGDSLLFATFCKTKLINKHDIHHHQDMMLAQMRVEEARKELARIELQIAQSLQHINPESQYY